MNWKRISLIFALLVLIISCKTSGPGGLFSKKSPHETYGQTLINAGLDGSKMGMQWFAAADASLAKALSIKIPYKEAGYFSAASVKASALRFEAKRGEIVSVGLTKRPEETFKIFVDFWEERQDSQNKLLAYLDTGAESFSQEIDRDGFYLVRLQPELLGSGEYTLTINNGPSLDFPVKNGKIQSFWGADRDNGLRSHEGVDIFAPRRTPALAVADGTITRVTVNKLGGNVVFLRPEKKNYNLYYAHLDEQLVIEGQKVKAGDTIGLVGNTGNAITTSPHLHLGIYSSSGPINPLPFVKQTSTDLPPIKSATSNLGKFMRVGSRSASVRSGLLPDSEVVATLAPTTLVEIESANQSSYRVTLPNGSFGFLNSSSLTMISSPVRNLKMALEKPLYDYPSEEAAKKAIIKENTSIDVIASFENYYYVSYKGNYGWIGK